jgi:hypothetical protein
MYLLFKGLSDVANKKAVQLNQSESVMHKLENVGVT